MTTQPIQSVNLNEISEILGGHHDQLMNIFTNVIPKELSKNYKDIQLEMESFTRELIEEMLKEVKVTIPSILILRLSQPTKFSWELFKHLLAASATVKRKFKTRFSHTEYDAEADILKTKQDMETLLESQYKTEVMLWRLMDNKHWKEALQVVQTIEMERKNAELPLKVEVANWKQFIAYHLGDMDAFLQSLDILLKTQKITDIKYSKPDMEVAISTILSKTLTKFGMQFTPIGTSRLHGEGPLFLAQQGQQFTGYLTGKIIDAIFKDRIISTGDEYRTFMESNKGNIITAYKQFNPFVANIQY